MPGAAAPGHEARGGERWRVKVPSDCKEIGNAAEGAEPAILRGPLPVDEA